MELLSQRVLLFRRHRCPAGSLGVDIRRVASSAAQLSFPCGRGSNQSVKPSGDFLIGRGKACLVGKIVGEERRSHIRSTAADEEPHGQTNKTRVKVVDYYMLLEVHSESTVDEVLKMLGAMWSLQYMVPNVLSASAGAILELKRGPLGAESSVWRSFTHALHFRFGNMEYAEAFRQDMTFLRTRSKEVDPRCARVAELVAVIDVPNELGAIFRRGGAWEEGVEHILVVRIEDVERSAAVDEYLSVLGDIAQSSACGALLSSCGPLAELSEGWLAERGGQSSTAPMLAMVTSVPSVEGFNAFLEMPPVQELLNEGVEGLLRPVCSLCYEITPTEGRQTRSPADGRIP